jgi:hypothetical protein
MAKFEDMVSAINNTSSPFALADDMPVFQAGLLDLQNRLQELEAKAGISPVATTKEQTK